MVKLVRNARKYIHSITTIEPHIKKYLHIWKGNLAHSENHYRGIDVGFNTMWCEFAQPDGLTDQQSNPWSCVYTTRKLFHMVVWVG